MWLNSPSKWPVWPRAENLLIQADNDEEVETPPVETPPVETPLAETTKLPNIEIQYLIAVVRFSKLLYVTTYVCQFTHNTRQPHQSQQVGPLTSSDLNRADLHSPLQVWTSQVPCMFVPLKEKARFTYAC